MPKEQPPNWYGVAHGPEAIVQIRKSARIAAQTLQAAIAAAKEGATASEVDRAAHEFAVSCGAYPAGVNYMTFPKAICISVNNVAVHGIPDERPLQNGDIANLDCAIFKDGYYGDCSAMVQIGEVDETASKLCQATRDCLYAAIAEVKPGAKLNRIGKVVNDLAKSRGFAVIHQFCGHFIGQEMHMQPNVLHVPNSNDLVLKPGMVFTIEPILSEGSPDIRCWKDGWTYCTKDHSWTAQWEHMVLVTEDGCEILTEPDL